MNPCCEVPAFEPKAPITGEPRGELRTVVLIGPPNAGKSTLFNRLTGLRQKVANYPGVTVEQRMGPMAGVGRDDLTIIDLPGVYSLTPYSEDARVAVDVLKGNMPGTPKPDAVLLVLDSLHLTRQLMLAAPVLALGIPTLVLLNMTDLMESRGGSVDSLKLARELGAPVAQISATHGSGLEAVPLFLRSRSKVSANGNGSNGSVVASTANGYVMKSTAISGGTNGSNAGLLALPVLGNAASTHSWAAQISRKTGYRAPLSASGSRKLDNILLHRVWGPLLFLVVVVGVFEVVFSIGQPLSDGFGDVLAKMGELVRPLLPVGWLQSLVLDGVWKGISSVLVFLPQILLLFLFIGVLEDSGYLARAALIADRVMRTDRAQREGVYSAAVGVRVRRAGDHGDPHHREQARPVCDDSGDAVHDVLSAAAGVHAADCGIHSEHHVSSRISGTTDDCDAGAVCGRVCGGHDDGAAAEELDLKSSETPFILELPQYRMPTLRSLGMRLVDRAKVFLHQAGTVILCVTMALWVLAHLPIVHTAHGTWSAPGLAESVVGRLGHLMEPADCAAGFQLEDRDRAGVERAGARGDGEHDGHAVRGRSADAGRELADRAAS